MRRLFAIGLVSRCFFCQSEPEFQEHDLQVLRVDGGASANDLLMQLQADLLQVPVRRPAHMETTAIGAAFAAGAAQPCGLLRCHSSMAAGGDAPGLTRSLPEVFS